MSLITASARPDPSAAIAEYWEKLAFYLRMAQALFGDPAKLARQLWLSRAEHKLFCDYIRPLEEIARRLIFALALKLAPMTLPPTPERKVRAHLAMPANAGAAFDVDHPESWRVSLKLMPERRRLAGTDAVQAEACASSRMPARASALQVSSATCAMRLEAVIRAYENRDALAAALARKQARAPVQAVAYTSPLPQKLVHKTGYNTLAELIPLIAEAQQYALHQQLDARLPAPAADTS